MRSGPVQHQLCIPLPFGFPLNLDKRRRETPVPAHAIQPPPQRNKFVER